MNIPVNLNLDFSKPICIENQDDLKDLAEMYNIYLRLTKSQGGDIPDEVNSTSPSLIIRDEPTAQGSSLITKTSPLGALSRNPPVGERAIDYAKRAAALYFGRNSFRLRDLIEKMAKIGWSSNAEDKANTIGATIRVDSSFQKMEEGYWRYIGEEFMSENEASPPMAESTPHFDLQT